MKKLEIKKLSPLNVIKIMAYFMALPMAIFLLVGLVMGFIGIVSGYFKLMIMALVFAVGYPLLLILIYGVAALVQTLLYNVFSSKFGGLEIEVDECKDITD